jgi:hypothetical protein
MVNNMTRTELVVLTPSPQGDAMPLGLADQQNGNFFKAPGLRILASFVAALDGTVTIAVPMLVDGDLAVAPRVLKLTANVPFLWIMNQPAIYMQPDGTVSLDFSVPCTVALVLA